MTEKETKKKLVIAFSAYSTHNKTNVSADNWLRVQDEKRTSGALGKRYRNLMKSK